MKNVKINCSNLNSYLPLKSNGVNENKNKLKINSIAKMIFTNYFLCILCPFIAKFKYAIISAKPITKIFKYILSVPIYYG